MKYKSEKNTVGKVYGVVVIGCGYIGHEHLEDIYYRENVRLVAVVDFDENRAKETARRYHVEDYGTDYRDFIGRASVDIVLIASYVDSHLEIMKACVEAGKHVLCEKPVASSRKAGEAFFEVAQQADVQVMVGHILRHNQSYQKVYQLIREGVIGKMRLIHFVQNHHAVEWDRYKRLLQDCPPVLDCGVHYLDVIQWMSEEKIVEIDGWSCKLDEESPCDNYGVAQMTLSGGCKGFYESGWSKNLKAHNCKEFIGEKGYIRLTLCADRPYDKEEGDLIEIYHSDTARHEIINIKAKYKDMNAQLQELVNRIEGKPQNSFSLEDAKEAFMAAIQVVEKI